MQYCEVPRAHVNNTIIMITIAFKVTINHNKICGVQRL